MRVCIINEFFYPDMTGGTGTVLSELARGLRAAHQDVEIDVVTSRYLYRGGDAPLPVRSEWEGVRIFRLATPQPNGVSMARRLAANAAFGAAALSYLLRNPRYEVILVGTAPPPAVLAAYLFRRISGTPYVYVVYDLEPDRAVALRLVRGNHPGVRLIRAWQRCWLQAAERVVVLGRCMEEHVRREYALPPPQIETIPVGADGDVLGPMPRASRFRERHSLDGFLVCYTGNFGRYHDFDTVLDAAVLLRDSDPAVRFVLVGDGAQRDKIAARIASERLDNVLLFPFVPQEDYPDLLASADVCLVTLEAGMDGLCVPSKFYSILASGRPTIAMVSPGCEVARVIAEARCGLRVDQTDPVGLAKAVAGLALRPDEVACMGARARAVLEDRYSTAHVTEHYYRTLTAAGLARFVHGRGYARRDTLRTPPDTDNDGSPFSLPQEVSHGPAESL